MNSPLDFKPFIWRVSLASSIVLLILLPLVWWVGQLSSVLGALAGALVGLANVAAGAWLLARLLGGAGAKGQYGVLLGLKLLLLAASIFVVIRVFGFDGFGVLMGFTAIVVALVFAGLSVSHDDTPKENNDRVG